MGAAGGAGGAASGGASDRPRPVASFDFEYDSQEAPDRVTIAMSGGNVLDEDNSSAVRYGVPPENLAEWPLPVEPGDRVEVEGVETGDTVVVVWESPDGDRSAVLQRFRVP